MLRRFVGVCGVACALLIALAAAVPTLAQGQLKLRITLQLPLSNHLGQNLVRFKQIVENRTNRRITVEIFDRAKLYKDFQVIDAVSSGQIEMGVVALNQYRKRIPAVDIFGQPFMFNPPSLVRAATKPGSAIRAPIDQAIRETTGTIPLWWQPYGTTVFFSRGRKGILLPDEVSKKRVRVISEAEGDFIKLCGGTGFRIPGSKQHKALADNKVDMGITGVAGVISRDLWKVSDTITQTDHSVIEFLVIINSALWSRLSPQDRSLIQQAGLTAEKELRDKFAAVEERAYLFAKSKKMSIFRLEQNDIFIWRACSAQMLIDFMDRAGTLGQRMLKAYGALRLDPCCSEGPPGKFTRR
ncbi:MAG: TRAP transporter substrate-binding protein DctP [Pseudomonadota bacterium]